MSEVKEVIFLPSTRESNCGQGTVWEEQAEMAISFCSSQCE